VSTEMYKVRNDMKQRNININPFDAIKTRRSVSSNAAAVISAKGMNRMIHKNITYRISNTVKNRNIQSSNMMEEVISKVVNSLVIDMRFRIVGIKTMGENAKNKGVMFPRLCGVFTNVAAIG